MAKKGRIVVIGGSSGMGLAVAQLMAKIGYEVIIAGRSKEKLIAARKAIGKASIHCLDFTEEKSVARFFSRVGKFDHLVIPAADFYTLPFVEGETKMARKYFDSKFWGQYACAKYGAPKIRKGGTITFFSGAAYDKPIPNFAAGGAVNGAVQGMSHALAVELSPIRVNTISPGLIETPLWNVVSKKDRDQIFKDAAKSLPAKRIGTPEDIAQTVRFIIECGYVTGTIVHVDGGFPLV